MLSARLEVACVGSAAFSILWRVLGSTSFGFFLLRAVRPGRFYGRIFFVSKLFHTLKIPEDCAATRFMCQSQSNTWTLPSKLGNTHLHKIDATGKSSVENIWGSQPFDNGISSTYPRVCCHCLSAMPAQHMKAPKQAQENTSPAKIDVTSNEQVSSWRHNSCHTDKKRYRTWS